MRLIDVSLRAALDGLFAGYGLTIADVAADAAIPGSYWGECEAGLIGSTLYLRADTPLHSALHEAAHYVCMDDVRRNGLERDAGGDVAEENAVCYLQILWADALPAVGREELMTDMDAWGYSFRLGSAARWFAEDAADALEWLQRRQLIDVAGRLQLQRAA
ncbi:MAG: hypothetical protein FJ179_00235 [Gammaproteobacteria bacterium]|nr:hypothetical protein [Gammaproteobacteria bacterium]